MIRSVVIFQKAYVDPDDPRFMIADEKDIFRFDLESFVHAVSFYDFNGIDAGYGFSPSGIELPKMKLAGRCFLGR